MKKKYGVFLVILVSLLSGCSKDPDGSYGTFTDSRDQHVYKYVKIGTQTWMAENLALLYANNPSSAGSETEPRFYVYDYDHEGGSVDVAKTKPNYTTYGVLYNWVAANAACPKGWHLPTDEEWKTLEKYLGMSEADANKNYALRTAGAVGGKLKETGTEHWERNEGANNSSGFTALPGGCRYSNWGFDVLGGVASFWSSSVLDGSSAWCRYLSADDDGVGRYSGYLYYGFSVRCLRD